ncbi:hypothetical protein [Pyrococcus kukulkanii]|uniref:hypothetical protein n=1 Tax=Pyrococcus kukulkanii TaxID=1609559 RepID=UPI003562D8C8
MNRAIFLAVFMFGLFLMAFYGAVFYNASDTYNRAFKEYRDHIEALNGEVMNAESCQEVLKATNETLEYAGAGLNTILPTVELSIMDIMLRARTKNCTEELLIGLKREYYTGVYEPLRWQTPKVAKEAEGDAVSAMFTFLVGFMLAVVGLDGYRSSR